MTLSPDQPPGFDRVDRRDPRGLSRARASLSWSIESAYFDGPGGTQVPRVVVEAMADYLIHHNANTHWAFPTSAETDAALAEARQALADFLNASPAEIAFGST